MKQYILEIIRQKWRHLSIIVTLLLLNIALSVVVSHYQLPALADLQTKWNSMRHQAATVGKIDATARYQQGVADLEKLSAKIPEKREFARVLSDLFESAAGSAVEMGTITYKPVQIKGEALLSYELSLSVSGSYAAVKSYLSDLQLNPELLVVDTVSLTNKGLFSENVVMNLHLTVYLRGGA